MANMGIIYYKRKLPTVEQKDGEGLLVGIKKRKPNSTNPKPNLEFYQEKTRFFVPKLAKTAISKQIENTFKKYNEKIKSPEDYNALPLNEKKAVKQWIRDHPEYEERGPELFNIIKANTGAAARSERARKGGKALGKIRTKKTFTEYNATITSQEDYNKLTQSKKSLLKNS